MSGGANQAKRPITETDEELAALVEGMSPVVIAVSAVHMTGSTDILKLAKPKTPGFNGDVSGQLSPEEAAPLHAAGLAAIKAWRAAGQPEPYQPTPEELHEMVNFVVGMEMPDSYVPMVLEDMGYDGGDVRTFRWNRPIADEVKQHYPVLIVGAGMSGLVMGLRLRQAGIPFTIVEKNESAGGTWFEDQYPGLRVDVPSHAYSFSFTQDHRWPNLYSRQDELLRYFLMCVDRFGIGDRIRYGLEVEGAHWDEPEQRWSVDLVSADGARETLFAKALVSAVGFLNRPSTPAIEGAETFRGAQFHSARWRKDVALEGKRVIVIGSAATALQASPPVAEIAGHLTIFQRSAGWTRVSAEYTRAIHDSEQWAIDHVPYYSGWMRATIFNWPIDFLPDVMKVDPAWPQDGRSVSRMNELVRQRLMAQLEEHLGDRPDLLAKMTPNYPPFVKRPTVSNGNFFRAIKQPNVEVVADAIERITETGIVDSSGRVHEADVIIYATGFQVQKFLTPMVIRGRGGIALNDYWQDRPGGYLGIVVPKFPNFFMMYGPGTNLGYNGNLIFNSELQARYAANCIRFLIEGGHESIEVRQEVFDDYMDRTGRKLLEFVWSTDYGTTYFRNAKGRVTTNSPWSLIEMWNWTQGPDPEHFLVDAPAKAAA
ncbi:flavin-containing monooxygenase [Sphingomonas bacterium]|uniref:flavin-containing monooxygenase n=1 Tax=Sphingomonas bacterium TaxID=1895847 RepID=UPI001574F511|nr:NAD(P)/FAD-dependent oxidoreductase [Sphingomonas bacterium]